ncbi:hypothetical protein AAK894_14220, partial [Lachnospiraceae bacterium 46-61]
LVFRINFNLLANVIIKSPPFFNNNKNKCYIIFKQAKIIKKCNCTVKKIGVYFMKNNKNMSCKTVLERSSLSSLLTPTN